MRGQAKGPELKSRVVQMAKPRAFVKLRSRRRGAARNCGAVWKCLPPFLMAGALKGRSRQTRRPISNLVRDIPGSMGDAVKAAARSIFSDTERKDPMDCLRMPIC